MKTLSQPSYIKLSTQVNPLFYWQTLKYFRMKQQSPELFRVSPPSEVRHILEMQMQYMIPLRDPCGRQVFIFRVGKIIS